MFKLLVNDKCMMVQCSLAYMIKLMCDPKMNILSFPALRNQVAQNVHSLKRKFKLLVNDKCMMVQCSLAYIVTLAMCDMSMRYY